VSIRTMTWVWDHAPVSDSTHAFVLLALADRADDNGLCWPSVKDIARRARVHERTAQRALKALETAGQITRVSTRGHTTRYRITFAGGLPGVVGDDQTPDNLPPRQDDTPGAAPGRHPRHQGVTPTSQGGDTGVTRTIKNRQGTASSRAGEHAALSELKTALTTAGLSAGWSKVTDAEYAEVLELVQRHGPARLVATALERHIPADPARKASAWFQSWRALQAAPLALVRAPHCGYPDCHEPSRRRTVIRPDGTPASLACPECHPTATARAAS
jgi:hypothetical protein